MPAGARLPLWPRIARAIVRAALHALFRPRLVGTPPREGPYLVVANHMSWVDPFLLLAEFPPEPRLHFVADAEAAAGVWWRRALLRSFGAIVLLDRSVRTDPSAVRGARRVLEAGGALSLMPEGPPALEPIEGEVRPFRRGAAYLAIAARAPVLPVGIGGSSELSARRELVARVGELVAPPNTGPTREATLAFTSVLHERVSTLAAAAVPVGPAKKGWRWLTHLF